MTRTLIVNADDFGRTAGVTRGIVRAHEEGIVTSATLMVRWPAAEDAAAYARRRPELSVGLHFDLSEWEYTQHEWRPTYQVVDADDGGAVEVELERQLDRFVELVGCPPTHLDSHQHVHREEPVRSAVAAAGRRLGVVVRDLTPGVRYCGNFYGQDGKGYPMPEAITVDALIGLVRGLPDGVTELGCHPGDPSDLVSSYRDERAVEVEVLCDPLVRRALEEENIELRRFGALAH